MKLRFIDLFGAPGGMSLGMKMAGLQPVAVLDNFEEGLKTYGKNFPEVPEQNIVNADASEKDIVKIFQRQTGLRPDDVDVIVGGPPCQGFSTVGRVLISKLIKKGMRSGRNAEPRFIHDKRNNLYKTFVKFVKYYKPRCIVMENVRGMVSYRNGWAVKQITDDFRNAGYPNIDNKILNAADYGAPQIRKRIFFIATRENKIKNIQPPPTHFVNSGLDRKQLDASSLYYVTVMEAIGDLPHLSIPEKAKKSRMQSWSTRQTPRATFKRGREKTAGRWTTTSPGGTGTWTRKFLPR
uniref:DNA (cytosine-5-)-methyltransferase n=1 Tax=uncultured marine thaumarchaeote KM3_200_B02 TaxID=1456093 RepID=A0A075GW17_9ARCH|nr:putative 5-methylcytosine methyltransferase (DNMT, dcm) [uncultured marine thaumarchaeote KM3_200_B02]